jgi:broad specificity phosphatase PhoE
MGALYLVRHGQASRYDDGLDALSDLGADQARALGAELARRRIVPDRIVTGGLRRQQETAAAITGPAPEIDPRWDEYDHLRMLATHGDLDLSQGLQHLLDTALAAWIEGTEEFTESWPAFRDRVAAALDQLRAATGIAVVVTSAGPISAVAAALLGVPAEGWLALNRVMVNTSITTLAVGRRGISLVSFNDHAHVAGDDRRLLTYR